MRPRPNLTKSIMTLIALALMLVSLSGAAGAQETRPLRPVPDPPELDNVEAWALVDADSGLYLAGENPDEQLPIASVTKMMTALVALEEGADLDEEVTVSPEAESYVGLIYSNVGLIAGERLSVRDLLAASLIPSGTDAAFALAEYLGGGSANNFVGRMNAEASSMGLENTRFDSPAGLESDDNYSNVRELAEIARAGLEYPLFAELVDTTDATITTQNREIEIFNTNQLLNSYPPATGVKTGTSPQAGANLVASAEAGDESYIAVVLGAEDSEDDTGVRLRPLRTRIAREPGRGVRGVAPALPPGRIRRTHRHARHKRIRRSQLRNRAPGNDPRATPRGRGRPGARRGRGSRQRGERRKQPAGRPGGLRGGFPVEHGVVRDRERVGLGLVLANRTTLRINHRLPGLAVARGVVRKALLHTTPPGHGLGRRWLRFRVS